MPHIHIDHSANITANITTTGNLKKLTLAIHQILLDVGGIPIVNCKTRWDSAPGFCVGDGTESHAFVHVSIRFLAGRPVDKRQNIGKACLAVMESHFAGIKGTFDLQLTVEIAEIDPEMYFKTSWPADACL